jgi:thiamine-monophosphate kinase
LTGHPSSFISIITKMTVTEVGEFSLIQRFSRILEQRLPAGLVGIGDDCAVIPQSGSTSLLVTADLLIEDVHFLTSAISPFDLGHKALAVNLSDIAAMGGKPTFAFISLAVPQHTQVSWLDGFYEGFRAFAQSHGVFVLGGDTTQSPSAIAINITLMGEAEPPNIKLRSTAIAGDIVCVTGILGDSAGGLKAILENIPADSADLHQLLQQHHRPQPHVKAGQWLGQHTSVHALMDVSDGIASDLQRIAEQSRCGVRIQLETLPISLALQNCAKKFGWNATKMATEGGEDYCLLATVDPKSYDELNKKFQVEFNHPLYAIGEITSTQNELLFFQEDTSQSFANSGFNHFKR